jgi:hypothetical protein
MAGFARFAKAWRHLGYKRKATILRTGREKGVNKSFPKSLRSRKHKA